MTLQPSSFENFIDSFRKICHTLEGKAEFNLKQIERECEQEYVSNAKSFQKFNEIIQGIGETCSEVVGANEILKRATRSTTRDDTINLPYEMQSDFVMCVNELYNMGCIGRQGEDKLVNEKNKELVRELTKICEKSVHEVRDVENAIVEAKELVF